MRKVIHKLTFLCLANFFTEKFLSFFGKSVVFFFTQIPNQIFAHTIVKSGRNSLN